MNLVAASRLARELMDQHGLKAWTFEFDDAVRRAGMCSYGKSRISLSAPITRIHEEREVRDTILHEVAHALAGPRAKHGPAWREVAVRIGCSGRRCVDPSAPSIDGPWVGTCSAGHRTTRFRRPPGIMSCRSCGPRFALANLVAWTYKGRNAAMGERYDAQLRGALREVGEVPDTGPGAEERVVRAARERVPGLSVEPFDLSALR
ncbi:SprT-like domain-containing protein [Promicromonospora sp. NPDC023987]|uniref:SprT-like domain-containing protein n=1 Tax=Promicromonospora sp. NPDC023987 TaxID=3155360 RepID=UPI003401F303